MNSKYQQYYNELKDKPFASYVNNYVKALNTINTSVNNINSVMSSCTEKGVEYIKNSILPSLKNEGAKIENGLRQLTVASSKVTLLVAKLSELKNACDSYASCKEEDKASYKSKIDSLEKEADALINEINSLSLDANALNDNVYVYAGNVNGTGTSALDSSTLAAKRAEFIGDVNDTSKYYVDPKYAKKLKQLVCFDNTTGEVLQEGDTLYMKPGETRVLTVRLPYNAGQIDKLLRTTADGDGTFRAGTVATAQCDVNPDPNIIDYVNYKEWSNHIPDNVDLHTNYYDWIITAKANGTVTVSQTCEYTNPDGYMPKAMVGLTLVVKDDEE